MRNLTRSAVVVRNHVFPGADGVRSLRKSCSLRRSCNQLSTRQLPQRTVRFVVDVLVCVLVIVSVLVLVRLLIIVDWCCSCGVCVCVRVCVRLVLIIALLR